jgi:hypothetical protein
MSPLAPDAAACTTTVVVVARGVPARTSAGVLVMDVPGRGVAAPGAVVAAGVGVADGAGVGDEGAAGVASGVRATAGVAAGVSAAGAGGNSGGKSAMRLDAVAGASICTCTIVMPCACRAVTVAS